MILNAPDAAQSARSRFVVQQAALALRDGDWIEAELTLRKHIQAYPDDADALTKLAAIVGDQSRIEESAMLLRRAAAIDASPARQLALARQLLALAGPTVALKEVQSFSAASRNDFDMRNLEALLLGMSGRLDEQLELFDEIERDYPRAATTRVHHAFALNSVGRTEDAVAALRRAIAIEPSMGEAYWALANLKSFRFSDRDVAALRKLLASNAGEQDRIAAHFALGRALEQRGEFEASFEQYAAGNRIRAAGLAPAQMQVSTFVDATIAAFDAKLFDRCAASGRAETGPIFIVGLHRSGSTLIEQILSTHPDIEGLGELPVLKHIWERISRKAARERRNPFDELASWDPSAFAAIGAEYLERTRPFRTTDRPWFIDKLPPNWLHVGLIRLVLPNARIIDARRSPMACGFSNFKQHYPVGVAYSYSLDTIGRFYQDYLRLMVHFDQLEPGATLHVVNEELIEDPEREVRRMLAYVGVPYDPSCLDFHSNKRTVQTPSAQQVRRPINRDGMDAWRPYEPWLGELKNALGPALTDWLPNGVAGSRAATHVDASWSCDWQQR